MKMLKIHKASYTLHGFDIELLKSYPYGTERGDIPSFLLAVDDPTDFDRAPDIIEKNLVAFVEDPLGNGQIEQAEKLKQLDFIHR